MNPTRAAGHCGLLPLMVIALLMATATVGAQTTRPAPVAPAITLNFPTSIDVKTFVDYVGVRTGTNIVYDDELLKKAGTVTIRSPESVSPDQLPALLADVLQMKGLAVAEDPRTHFRSIVPSAESLSSNPATVDHVVLKYADASRLAPQIKQLVTASMPAGRRDQGVGFDVAFDARTSQIVAIGPAEPVRRAMEVASLLDVPVAAGESPIRFYKLTNATAADVLDTIRSLEGKPPAIRPQAAVQQPRDISSSPNGAISSPSGGNGAFGSQANVPTNTANTGQNQPAASNQTGGGSVIVQPPSIAESIQATPADGGGGGADAGKLGYESVTADTNTNTIIVRGSAEVQRTYERLIKTLDQRRPQVLLEATVVTLDTTHNFSFGVEFSAHSNGATKILSFSQFGLSSVNTSTGALSINPNTGLNTAVIGSGVANAVIQALVTDSHARVQSAPRVLVNDNATGLLTSISEQPFTSVNASTTVATTSFGGYADAGTTITLTPHISQGDYLQLEYSVELSSFTGLADATTGSPPPRQTDRVESKVTIPDGSTIIVGGLNRTTYMKTVNAIPIIGQIPVLGWLFSQRSTEAETSTLFVFLRPTILRDEEFADLKNISESDLKDAGLPGNLPQSGPEIMR